MIDTHAHLQWPDFQRDIEQVIKRAFAAGLRAIVGIGYDLKASREAVQIAHDHEHVYAVVGIHPHNAKILSAGMLGSLRELARDGKVVAIGEIGLDYYRDLSPRTSQKEAFEQQIQLARELDLPIVVHDREAHGDVINALRKAGRDVGGVLHCFSGSIEMALEAIELGYFISIAGPVTFPNARRLHDLVKQLPEEHILLETDCPWLSPQSKRGQRNEPAYLVETAQKVADLRKISLNELSDISSGNVKRLFGIV